MKVRVVKVTDHDGKCWYAVQKIYRPFMSTKGYWYYVTPRGDLTSYYGDARAFTSEDRAKDFAYGPKTVDVVYD